MMLCAAESLVGGGGIPPFGPARAAVNMALTMDNKKFKKMKMAVIQSKTLNKT